MILWYLHVILLSEILKKDEIWRNIQHTITVGFIDETYQHWIYKWIIIFVASLQLKIHQISFWQPTYKTNIICKMEIWKFQSVQIILSILGWPAFILFMVLARPLSFIFYALFDSWWVLRLALTRLLSLWR